jgi:hypothetical protein
LDSSFLYAKFHSHARRQSNAQSRSTFGWADVELKETSADLDLSARPMISGVRPYAAKIMKDFFDG